MGITSGRTKGRSFWWQPVWKTASIFAEFEEVEKEISLSSAGQEVCQVPCFSVGLSWSLIIPAGPLPRAALPGLLGLGEGFEKEQGVGMAGNSWADQ